MIFYVYDAATGQILRTGNCQDSMVEAQAQPGECAVGDAVADPERFYVDTASGALVEFPARPSGDHRWDWDLRAWAASPADALARRLRELKARRDAALHGGFVWQGHRFDSDETAQTRTIGMFTSAVNTPAVFPVNWRLADNSWLALSAADAVGVWAALQSHVQHAFTNFASHEAALLSLATVADLQGYDIDTGW